MATKTKPQSLFVTHRKLMIAALLGALGPLAAANFNIWGFEPIMNLYSFSFVNPSIPATVIAMYGIYLALLIALAVGLPLFLLRNYLRIWAWTPVLLIAILSAPLLGMFVILPYSIYSDPNPLQAVLPGLTAFAVVTWLLYLLSLKLMTHLGRVSL